MITLYGAGPKFSLPDASPFVCKTIILLKMAGAPYRFDRASFSKAPKGKIPYIEQNGKLIGDSTFIRWHLEDTYGADFDKGLTDAEKAVAWAFEKLCEDHLYWTILDARWMSDANFQKGPVKFFDAVPALIRPLIIGKVRRDVRSRAWAQGIGRHSKAEIERLALRDIDAISAFLAEKLWLMGDQPCGADAAVWSTIAGALSPTFDTPIRTAAEGRANLVAYRDRGLAYWFPDFDASTH